MRKKAAPHYPAVDSRWKKVIELGERLFTLGRTRTPALLKPQELVARQKALIEQTTRTLFGGEVEVWLAEPHFSREIPWQIEAPDALSPLMRVALQEMRLCLGDSAQANRVWLYQQEPLSASPSAVAVPMCVTDEHTHAKELVGLIQIERSPDAPFEAADLELCHALASQAALSIAAARHLHLELWRQEQLKLVGQVSARIASLRDLDELAREVTQRILKTFGYYYVAIFTLEPHQEILRFRASAGPGEQSWNETRLEVPLVFNVSLGEGMIGYAAQTGEELIANDIARAPHFRPIDSLPETRSEAVFPLKVEDRVLGVIDVQSNQLNGFDELDVTVLRALAGSIAVAVEGAQLYSALSQRARQLTTLYEVSQAITSILDQDELLDTVVHLIRERFGYPFVHLFSVHLGYRKVIYVAGSGTRSQALRALNLQYDLDDPLGIIPWVARRGETVLANDVNEDPRYRPSPLPPADTRAELTVPLVFGDHVLGVLDIQSDQLNAFTEEDRFLFEALADHIAIAMRNAALYRSEIWRRQVTDSLREVAGLLSADVDLDKVLHAILEELARTLPLDIAAIWLLKGEAREGEEGAALRLAAFAGEAVAQLDLDSGISPEELLECNPPIRHAIDLQQTSLWLDEVLRSEGVVIRSPSSAYDPLGAALDYPPEYSAIAAPLRLGERLLGVLTLASGSPGRYGDEARLMSMAFASYASIAIENTRLYEAAHDQAWVSTVLLQVANAVNSIDNLVDLLDTIIRLTPTLAGVQACLIYLFDEDGYFIPFTSWGLDAERKAEFERWRFLPSDAPALRRLLDEKFPVMVNGLGEDARLASIVYGEGEINEARLQVLVPMLSRNELLGFFFVDYGSFAEVTGEAIEELFEDRLAIVQGIAQQTSVAVENIRLMQTQKEEAYITVALLQIAQTVVSSNDLEEILASTIRTIPILVGVQRTAVFLWDAENELFTLAQSYGLSSTQEDRLVKIEADQFPLLKRVIEKDEVTALSISSMLETGQVLEGWSKAKPPPRAEVQNLMQKADCLILAFPISVKGEMFGVLVIEEPTQLPSVERGVTRSNRQLRSRRVEITTGISRQLAVAIQNDRLQRQRVEQERLEGEMQLAREIQQAFLPHEQPSLPGWDLKVLWSTAREVGGDFYDYFTLPDGKFGIVVADVADKGMPAALFMTLVRTLVRATVQEGISPHRVLERVNNVILPDAPQGMFVTLVYAVLDIQKGVIQLVNAGHNPPLIWHQAQKKLRSIPKSGMALGVQEDVLYSQKKILLTPGDFLILYTDGITEAFSREGQIFGEARFRSLIETTLANLPQTPDATRTDAEYLVETIQRAVREFVGEGLPSDDLTLLVLHSIPFEKESPDVGGARPAI